MKLFRWLKRQLYRSRSKANHLDLGRKGEDIALKFLRKKRYRLLQRNYVAKNGEIDIVMQDRDQIVFVEVKARTSEEHSPAERAVGPQKRKHLIWAAKQFIYKNKLQQWSYRFDVVIIVGDCKQNMQIRHYCNAFRK